MGPTAPPDLVPVAPASARRFPRIVLALAFGLLLSDYMSRQVLSAVFPILKSEWTLTDTHLATLSSVVALMVGLLTFPLSIVADRWGRVRSLVVMAVLWSVATLLCALSTGYGQMLGARFLVGVGEAAYGSVGIAVVLRVFAPRRARRPQRRLHGRRFLRVGARRGARRPARRPVRLALVVRGDGRVRSRPRGAVRRARHREAPREPRAR